MNLKVTLFQNDSATFRGLCAAVFFVFIFFLASTKIEKLINDLPSIFVFLLIFYMSGLVAFISLRPPNITLNNNFFTIGRSKIFQKNIFGKILKSINLKSGQVTFFFILLIKTTLMAEK